MKLRSDPNYIPWKLGEISSAINLFSVHLYDEGEDGEMLFDTEADEQLHQDLSKAYSAIVQYIRKQK